MEKDMYYMVMYNEQEPRIYHLDSAQFAGEPQPGDEHVEVVLHIVSVDEREKRDKLSITFDRKVKKPERGVYEMDLTREIAWGKKIRAQSVSYKEMLDAYRFLQTQYNLKKWFDRGGPLDVTNVRMKYPILKKMRNKDAYEYYNHQTKLFHIQFNRGYGRPDFEESAVYQVEKEMKRTNKDGEEEYRYTVVNLTKGIEGDSFLTQRYNDLPFNQIRKTFEQTLSIYKKGTSSYESAASRLSTFVWWLLEQDWLKTEEMNREFNFSQVTHEQALAYLETLDQHSSEYVDRFETIMFNHFKNQPNFDAFQENFHSSRENMASKRITIKAALKLMSDEETEKDLDEKLEEHRRLLSETIKNIVEELEQLKQQYNPNAKLLMKIQAKQMSHFRAARDFAIFKIVTTYAVPLMGITHLTVEDVDMDEAKTLNITLPFRRGEALQKDAQRKKETINIDDESVRDAILCYMELLKAYIDEEEFGREDAPFFVQNQFTERKVEGVKDDVVRRVFDNDEERICSVQEIINHLIYKEVKRLVLEDEEDEAKVYQVITQRFFGASDLARRYYNKVVSENDKITG